MVDSTDIIQSSIGQPFHLIAGAIESLTSLERVGDKTLRRQLRLASVASGETHPADIQLTWNPDGDRFEIAIQYVDLRVRDRTAERNRPFSVTHAFQC